MNMIKNDSIHYASIYLMDTIYGAAAYSAPHILEMEIRLQKEKFNKRQINRERLYQKRKSLGRVK